MGVTHFQVFKGQTLRLQPAEGLHKDDVGHHHGDDQLTEIQFGSVTYVEK